LKKNKFEFKKLTFFILFFCAFINAKPQQIISENWGLNAGISISYGTHIKQVGLFFRTYLVFNKNLQWNNDLRLCYFFRNIGPKKSHTEIQISTGLLFGYGNTKVPETFFINKISNQTHYQNSVAYAYNGYFNTIKTSQQTGTIGLGFNSIHINLENDLFAKASLDRFRTGSLQVTYQKENLRLSITHQMWTGKLGKPIYDSLYPNTNGYLDTTNAVYPFLSHGILCASADFVEKYYFQQFRGAIGIDADQLRHVVQNKLMHDELYLPKKLRSHNNHHFPMIDTKDEFYLFKPSQKIRKPKLFTQFYLNPEAIE
jgi:hypothetical protein